MKMEPLAKVYLIIAAFVLVNQSPAAAYCDESRIDSLGAVVYDREMTFSDKLETLNRFNEVSSCIGSHFERIYPVLNDFLQQGKRENHRAGILFCYNFMADLYLGLWDRERTRRYLDSAAMHIDKTVDVRHLAPYFRMKGQYLQRYYPDQSPEAVEYYHKSLSYYEETGYEGKENDVVIVLRNLVFDGLQRNDSVSVHRYMERMTGMRETHASPMLEFVLMDIKASLHDFHFQRSREEAFLDSSIHYAREGLALYERGLQSRFYRHVAVDLYVMLAGQLGRKKNSDLHAVDSLLAIAGARYDPDDSAGMARICHAKAKILYERNMPDSAEAAALKAERYLEAGYGHRNNYFLLAKENIKFLCDIYEAKGDWKRAIEYRDLWMRKDREIRANEVKELELRYEIEAKEAEIKCLNSDRLYQENRYKRFVLICCLLCLAIIFMYLLLRLKRRDLNSQIALFNAEKEEAKLKLKLREEQTVKALLEKYEVLSDFHLREMELIGKSKDLDNLRQDKAALDRQVELYRQKIEDYEAEVNRKNSVGHEMHDVIVEDLKYLINKQLKPPLSDEYLHNIRHLGKSCLETFREKSNENLSIPYLKYCICFAIGMGIAEVAECFCIEPSSVHMIRYRLKKKFGLGNDDDLGLSLQKYSSL
ncbi:MAG: hypothetical protein LBJ47_01920 [Tannerella sp.]|jgi:hypothetical protein|nr:hypothetical protein [Tannerella sp.]